MFDTLSETDDSAFSATVPSSVCIESCSTLDAPCPSPGTASCSFFAAFVIVLTVRRAGRAQN